MTADRDDVGQLLSLLEATADSVSNMSDDEVQTELAPLQEGLGPSVGDIVGRHLQGEQPVSAISPGDFVRLKTDPTRAGRVLEGARVQASRRMLRVQFADGSVASWPESALEVVPAAAPPLVERFATGRFADPGWLRRTLARIRVTGRLSDVMYSMEATETDFYAYQYKPVLKLLNSPTDALLIADEVGLGKTIEAGLIWTELRARLESNRLLVLCPKTLCVKWQSELDRRFGVDARIVNAADLIQLITRSNGRGFAAIASMQSLRPPRGWNNGHDEEPDASETPRLTLAKLLDEAADGEPLLDLLVIDEAHHMRNPETLLYNLGQLVNSVSSHRVFLSATPIHLRNRDLNSLLRLIDPDTFQYESTLEELILTNAPIVEARDLLTKPGTSAEAIIELISRAREYELLADSSALERIQGELETKPLDEIARVEIASRLEQVNQLANYVTRTRRREVSMEFRVQREPTAPTLRMAPDEEAFYTEVTREVIDYAKDCDANERFLLSTPQRLLTSSPAAASAHWAAYHGGAVDPVEETDDDIEHQSEPDERPLVSRLSALCRSLNMTLRLEAADQKYALLLSQLRKLWKDDPGSKIVVFSSFKPTLHYLRKRLEADGIGTELLHGSVKEPRDAILQRFERRATSKVLLSSEIGSEGVDLQFCWIIVNYDLPWNPMRLEQRIGRVDRLGQKSPKVVILNLIYDNTIDKLIYHRLYERLGIGQRALGEFEAVLGQPIREMTLKLLDPTLTAEQKQAAVDFAAQAAAQLKQHEDQLEAEAGSLIRHGDYILEKIREARELNRWLDADDVLIYVRDRLQRSYPKCVIETAPPGSRTYRINLSAPARGAFAMFLARRGLRGVTRLLDGNDQQRYQFSSSVVPGSDSRVETISQVHPLVRFAADLDRRDELGNRPEPVAATIAREELKHDCKPGVYVLAIHRWVGNSTDSRTTKTARLAYAGAEIATGTLLRHDIAEALAAAAADRGKLFYNIGTDDRLAIAATLLKSVVVPELDRRFEEFDQQIATESSDRASIQRRAVERHRDSKTAMLTEQLDRNRYRAETAERTGDQRRARQLLSVNVAIEGKLRKLRQTCERRLAEIEVQRDVVPLTEELSSLFIEVVK
jgi:superfamily II DNA or RNA helicase